jgi:glucose-6-phosphate 1-dehydrogenase
MWKFIDPIITMWEKNAVPLRRYKEKSKTLLQDAVRVEE